MNNLSIATYFRNTDHADDSFQKVENIDESDWGNWRRLEAINSSHTVSIPMKHLGPGDPIDQNACKMRLVCTRLRNWSHDHTRLARIEAAYDASQSNITGCTDYTVVSEEYLSVKISAMDRDLAVQIFEDWRKRAKH